MAAVTHLLDTSALLAHYFDEPGAEEVDRLWQQPGNKLAISVLSIPELKTRLRGEVADAKEVERAFGLYANELTVSIPVSRAVAEEAVRLREATPRRLPLIDALIAASASNADCVLVHRDPHMDDIPTRLVRRMRLPEK